MAYVMTAFVNDGIGYVEKKHNHFNGENAVASLTTKKLKKKCRNHQTSGPSYEGSTSYITTLMTGNNLYDSIVTIYDN